MAADEVTLSPPLPLDVERLALAMEDVRERTLAMVDHLDDDDLARVHSPIMSPLAWDLAHIAAYEDLWLASRDAGLELLRPELAALYDAFETPRAIRGEIDALDPPAARDYLAAVRERVLAAMVKRGVANGDIYEMVIRHELQHTETMRQTMAIAGLLPPGEPALAPLTGADGWAEVPAGDFSMGAPREGFAYDNERPRHEASTGAFRIARRPVTNASWMNFSEGGGYERREWWSDEGWAWKEEYDITHHPSIAAGPPGAAACHVSWFEADAFARAHDARLPTEAEWERAATWTRERGARAATTPHGGDGANGAMEWGTLAEVGHVWEWTRGLFAGYPGFVPYPYREYSQVFFGKGYRVLRGASWATHPRVATATFRNWDLPVRRQIFAGVRLVRDP